MKNSVFIYESNQQDATLQVNLLFLISPTCFRRCFRPPSGALDYLQYLVVSLRLLLAGVLDDLKLKFQIIQDTSRQQLERILPDTVNTVKCS
jgi:hypothetical protein